MEPILKKRRFFNSHISDEKKSLWDFFLWKLGRYKDPSGCEAPPSDFVYPAQLLPYDRALPSAAWVGHSTYFVQGQGWALLTDPIWSRYCAPLSLSPFRRLSEPALALEEIPRLDWVLISHNHYDHLDIKTVERLHHLQPQIEWIVPQGLSPWFRRRKISHCTELGWWKTREGNGCRITAVPAQHFSGRILWDRDKTLWNGYVVECLATKRKLYFCGDTGYNPYDFKEIGHRLGPMDLSLLPIGSYVPRAFMSPVHCNPADAVQIHLDVHSRLSLGMHWKTFRLSEEPFLRPTYDLYLAMRERSLPYSSFLPGELGAFINW